MYSFSYVGMKIYLIRHGETTGDIENRYGGSYDDHLTSKGRQQIERTANNLPANGVEVIFTSPLIRAREAAEIIKSRLGCEIKVAEGIKERSYGVLGGLTKAEALKKYPEAVEMHKDSKNTDPEGESQIDFIQRVTSAFKDISSESYNTVVIISHGGPIKIILKHLSKNIPSHIEDGEIIAVDV